MAEIETDYLVVGAGAAGMGFADELIARCDADVVIVDRRHRPGGHWNDGYSFLRLHQPSAFYGVNSSVLGSETIDATGSDAGLYGRASVDEIRDYYQRVLEQKLLASSRVRFHGMCDYVGDWSSRHGFRCRLTGRTTEVRVRRRIVDARYLESSIPGTHAPTFDIGPGARLVPVGQLHAAPDSPTGYTVLGGGKTAMDACNWLLDNGVDPGAIRWIKPREAWVIDRKSLQPLDLLGGTMESLSHGVEALAEAERAEELFERLEASGLLCRVDTTVEATMYKGAVLSRSERERLQQIERVVRLGRVVHLGAEEIVLERGTIPTRPGELHVDCTADGLPARPARPIFEPGRITIQSLVGGQTSAAAATIAYVESERDDDIPKNRLCQPHRNPSAAIDFVRFMQTMLGSFAVRLAEPDLTAWWDASRVNLTRGLGARMSDPLLQTAMTRFVANAEPALTNAGRLLAHTATGTTTTSQDDARRHAVAPS